MEDHGDVRRVSAWRDSVLPGLLVTGAVAAASFGTWWLLRGTWVKFSALLWAFIYSLVLVNVHPRLLQGSVGRGVEFCSTRLLRFSIAALGLTVSASVWTKLGGVGLATVLLTLLVVFAFGLFFCRWVLRLELTLALLISAGTAICGASAIAAVGPALKARAEEMGLAVAAITLFGLAAMFGYPLLFDGFLGGWLQHSPQAFGMWAGTGIHETAQVIAAASQVDESLAMATSAKFIRIFMIGPMVIGSVLLFSRLSGREGRGAVRVAIPWFAFVFVLLTFAHYALAHAMGDSWVTFVGSYLSPVVTFLLAWAFAGIGLRVRISTIRSLGMKAFLGGLTVAVFAGVTSLLLVRFLWMRF